MNITLELLPVDSTDLEQLRSWRNDHRIWRWCRQSDLISDVEQKAWFERQAKDPTIRMYKAVRAVGSHVETVGVCGLTSIDQMNRRAEFSLYVAPELHKQGLGAKILALLLQHGFLNLGLNVIWGETFDGNPAWKMFEKLGFEKEGIRRQFYFKGGRFIDAHLYSITRESWNEQSTSPS
jgi:RimJ/RimL family protein N-acetyltransferase